MRAARLIIIVGIVAGLVGVLPVSAAAPSWSIGISSVAACKDSLTVAVAGSSTYSKNRLDVGVYYLEQGNWKLLQQVFTPQFGAGPFSLAVPLQYSDNAATAGETLRVDVQLQRLSGNSYVDEGSLIMQTVTVADTDWPQIVGLYDMLLQAAPSPVFETSRAVAVAMWDGPAAGLALIDAILSRGDLADLSV